MSVPAVLRRAAEVYQRNGAHKGSYYNAQQEREGVPVSECRVCVLGAIDIAAGGAPASFPDAGDQPRLVLAGHLGIDTSEAHVDGDVAAWHDARQTTPKQVVEALLAAAAAAEAVAS